MFQEALQFRYAIMFCYNKQTIVRVTSQVPPPLTWHISQIVVDCLLPIVSTCVINQAHGLWLFSDALHFVISMNLKLKEENKIIPSFESLMEDDSIISNELSLLAFNIRREVINVLNSFLSFLKKYENRKAHNMISLMLDPRFQSLRIISSFVGREQGIALLKIMIENPYFLCW